MNPRSLTFRLVAWYCGFLLLVGVLFAAYVYTRFTFSLHDTVRGSLSTRIKDIESLASPLLDDPRALANSIEWRFAPAAHDRLIEIRVNGRLLYTSPMPVDRSFNPEVIASEPRTSGKLQRIGGLWVLSRADTLANGQVLDVVTGELTNTIAADRRNLAHTLVIALPVLLCIAAIGGYWLVRRTLTPVANMINAAEALTFNSPHKRLPDAGTGDLLDELAQSLNRMLGRLDDAYQHVRRFSSDAAHEMRTPLAIARGELEYAVQDRGLTPEVRIALGNALDETIRLSQVVESLMGLSRIEGVAGTGVHRNVDLRELSCETIEEMRLLADEKKIAIDVDLACAAGEPVMAYGDPDRLRQVLVNLLDNAIKYTGVGGHVAVNVTRDAKYALLEVSDTGVGIAAEHHANIFERFFRVDPDRGSTGAGLGLAIVKSICLAHGGTITVGSTPGRGSIFRIQLPLAPAPIVTETDVA